MLNSILKPLCGSKRADLSPSVHRDRLQDADEFFCDRLLFDARRLQQEHERAGAAIHDGHFARRHVDVHIVDAQTRERRHQVLDRRYAHAVAFEARRQSGVADMIGIGLDIDRLRQIDAPKHDAGIGRGRTQRQIDLFAGMQSDAGGADDVFERALLDHELTL